MLKSLNFEQFQNCEATAEFIQKINNIFDILNSKNKFGRSFKSPLQLDNIAEVEEYLNEVIEYLKELKDTEMRKLVDGPRKTFILGFALSSKSIIAIAKHLLHRSYQPFEYVLTYRFSQDQVEMLFSKIRSRLGWNNNPNTLQFKWALRALLQKNQITVPKSANCNILDEEKLAEESCDERILRYINCSPIWREDVIVYIAGYIAKKIIPSMKCPECAEALVNDDHQATPDHSYSHPSNARLISFKSYGKLIVPSSSVIQVVKVTDRLLRQMMARWASLNQQALTNLERNVLLYRFGKVYSDEIVREGTPSKRPKLNKLILFSND